MRLALTEWLGEEGYKTTRCLLQLKYFKEKKEMGCFELFVCKKKKSGTFGKTLYMGRLEIMRLRFDLQWLSELLTISFKVPANHLSMKNSLRIKTDNTDFSSPLCHNLKKKTKQTD